MPFEKYRWCLCIDLPVPCRLDVLVAGIDVMDSGKVLELRRGLYTLSDTYRKVPVHASAIAHALYPPSYLSLEWALAKKIEWDLARQGYAVEVRWKSDRVVHKIEIDTNPPAGSSDGRPSCAEAHPRRPPSP